MGDVKLQSSHQKVLQKGHAITKEVTVTQTYTTNLGSKVISEILIST